MAIPVSLNGAPYSIPEVGDPNWAAPLSLYLQALATAFPQVSAGSNGFACYADANASAGSFTTGVTTIVVFNNETLDSDNAYNPGTGQFTVPTGKSGRYRISSLVTAASVNPAANSQMTLRIFKNAAAVKQVGQLFFPTGTAWFPAVGGSADLSLVAGDIIDVRLLQTLTATLTLNGAAIENWLTITRVL